MSTPPRTFASDNGSGIHPEILEAIAAANEGHATAYGDDPWTAAAEHAFREHFGPDTRAFPVFNGTAANVLAVDALTSPHEAVICPETAHLNLDECGAPERFAGVKLIPVPTGHGKLTPADVAAHDVHRGDQHAVQPRLVSISQATELGTVYLAEETRALADAAHERGLLLHVDGARLANAAASLALPLRALTTDADVDVLSFGGTKNGLLGAEAVVFLRPDLAPDFRFARKQGMQLASKMRFLSAQLVALVGEGELWRRNAEHANAMARRLAAALDGLEGIELAHPVEANAVFARLPRAAIDHLRAELPGDPPFYVWDEAAGTVRLMCSWDTTPEDVDALAAAVETSARGSGDKRS